MPMPYSNVMDLQEFSSPLPKPWLAINADSINTNSLSTGGNLAWGTYDPSLVVLQGLSGVTLANEARFFRLGPIAYLSGSFTANTIVQASALVQIQITLPPGYISTIDNHRAGDFHGQNSAPAGMKGLIFSGTANTAQNQIVFSALTVDNSNTVASTGTKFCYSLMFDVA